MVQINCQLFWLLTELVNWRKPKANKLKRESVIHPSINRSLLCS